METPVRPLRLGLGAAALVTIAVFVLVPDRNVRTGLVGLFIVLFVAAITVAAVDFMRGR